ncbi:MAG: anthranilate phosphoribosyltransferase [Aestuariibacter sp.]
MEQVYQQKPLSQQQSCDFFSQVMQGNVTDVALSAMLIALKMKGEEPQEIAGAAQAMIENAKAFPRPDYMFADIVGTGGDGYNTINISSAAAIVAASCGLPVAKHGNRSVSSKSGSADLFREFGLDLMMSPETARQCLDQTNLCFLFAPNYHAGVKHAMPVRTELKTRTIFNLLGPLANPAHPTHMMIGVYDKKLITPYAQTLQKLGYQNALVVHGSGLDEITLHDTTYAARISGADIEYLQLAPDTMGVERFPIDAIKGGEPEENKAMIAAVLAGDGAKAHEMAVAANAGALLTLANKARSFKEGTSMALEQIRSGNCINTIYQSAKLSSEQK